MIEKSFVRTGGPSAKRGWRSVFIPALAVIALSVFLAICKPTFFSITNLKNLLVQTSSNGIMAFGVTFVLISAGVDIAMPQVMLLSSVAGAIAMRATGSIALGIIAIFATAICCGSISGWLVAKCGMMPFIATLVMKILADGMSILISNSETIPVPSAFTSVGNGMLFGFLPTSILALLIIGVFMHLVLRRTVYGRRLYAIGNNKNAAYSVGINEQLMRFSVYVVSATTAAIGGIILTSRLGSASLTMVSDSSNLDIVCAAIVGGASTYGGVGSIRGAFLGALLIAFIQNITNLFGLSTFTMYMIKGAIILLCTYYDRVKSVSRR